MIYIIRLREVDFVKIGYTSKEFVDKRFAQISIGSPFTLVTELFIEGTLENESMLHRKFSESHYKNEWFQYTDEIKSYIEENRHLNKPFYAPRKHIKRAKYTLKEKEQVKELYKGGKSLQEMSTLFGCTKNAMSHLVTSLKCKRQKIVSDEKRNKYRIYNKLKSIRKSYKDKKISHQEMEIEIAKFPLSSQGRRSKIS